MEQLRNALQLYASDNNGNFPAGHFWSNQPAGNGIDFDGASSGLLASLSPYIKSLPHDPLEVVGAGSYSYYFTNNYGVGWIDGGGTPAGTCAGKAIIIIYQYETISNPRHECSLITGTDELPNGLVVQLN
jgi:hypothetical protein